MEALFTQGFAAVGNGTGGRTRGEDSVHAGGAHFVVAFWIDEELEGRIEVPVRLADGADII